MSTSDFLWSRQTEPSLKNRAVSVFNLLDGIVLRPKVNKRQLQFPTELTVKVVVPDAYDSCSFSAYRNRLTLPFSIPAEAAHFTDGLEAIWLHELAHGILETYLRGNSAVWRRFAAQVDRAEFIISTVFKDHPHKAAINKAANKAQIEKLGLIKSDTDAYHELFSDIVAWVGTGRLDSINRFQMKADSKDPHILLRDAAARIGRLIVDTKETEPKRSMLQALAELVRHRVERRIESDRPIEDWSTESNRFIEDYLARLKEIDKKYEEL